MTDKEFVLMQDNKERKEIAQKYKHKPKRSGCRMDTDHMTNAQLQRKNGPVVSYNLSEPMDWQTFKSLPEISQKLYLTTLIDRFSARDTMLAEMFGISHSRICFIRKELGVKGLGKAAPSRAAWERWHEWLYAARTTEETEPCETAPDELPQSAAQTAPSGRESAEDTIARLQAETEAMKAEQTERLRKAAEASWDNLFAMAKTLGEQYGLHVRIEVTV